MGRQSETTADAECARSANEPEALAGLGACALLEALPDATLIVDRTGQVVFANELAEDLFGYALDEMEGEPVEQLLPESFRGRHVEHRTWYAKNPCVRRMHTGMELDARHKDGHEIPVNISISRLGTEKELLEVCSIRDIFQRKRLKQQLDSVVSRLIHAQEEERKRVARELHDDVNQRLALLCVELDLLGQSLPDSAEEARKKMGQIGVQVRQVSLELHDLSHELHPSRLEYVGLVRALRSLCSGFAKRSGVRIEFSHRAAPESLGSKIPLCLYRIVQQALANVVKHSGSKEARVELVGVPGAIRLRIADSGVGFNPDRAAADGGLGLIGMAERVRLVGGEISIESEPSYGTRIEVRVPLGRPAD